MLVEREGAVMGGLAKAQTLVLTLAGFIGERLNQLRFVLLDFLSSGQLPIGCVQFSSSVPQLKPVLSALGQEINNLQFWSRQKQG